MNLEIANIGRINLEGHTRRMVRAEFIVQGQLKKDIRNVSHIAIPWDRRE